MKRKAEREKQALNIITRELVFFGLIVLGIVVLAMTFIACNPVESFNDWIGVKDDHLAEEISEEVIEHHTGVEADLTPRSPE